jgi:histidyl-tRNA synthetase
MNDVLPSDSALWRYIENIIRQTVYSFGYDEIRTPILEKTELFKRNIGAATDIVEKEMYEFNDRNGDSLALRPEGTASAVRLGLEHGLLAQGIQRWWYMGPMYRHERPQKGRYRQFYQLGVEAFGVMSADIDLEMILLSEALWHNLSLRAPLLLQINTLGTATSRKTHKEKLVDYLSGYHDELDVDSQRRLHTNPLRILDSKDEKTQKIIRDAPKLIDYLDEAAKAHFDAVCAGLDALGIAYQINPALVRGLDYYTHTVFEWVSNELGAQGTVCAGGRYDSLVEQMGGKPMPAVGFALGLERLLLLLQLQQVEVQEPADIYVVSTPGAPRLYALKLARVIRNRRKNLRVVTDCSDASFKNQFKKADKSGANIALIVGEDEYTEKSVTIKNLCNPEVAQKRLDEETVLNFVDEYNRRDYNGRILQRR